MKSAVAAMRHTESGLGIWFPEHQLPRGGFACTQGTIQVPELYRSMYTESDSDYQVFPPANAVACHIASDQIEGL